MTHPFVAELIKLGLIAPHPGAPATNGHRAAEPPPPPGDPRGQRYAAAARAAECAEVAHTPEGGRNHALNRASFRLGQLVKLGYLTRPDTEDDLLTAALTAGLGVVEARRTITSGLNAGLDVPRHGIQLHPEPPPVAQAVDAPAPAVPDCPGQLPPAETPGDVEHHPLFRRVDWIQLFSDNPGDQPDWLVPDILERGRNHVLYAPPKTGKSLLTQVLCGDLGHATVVYIDYENSRADILERFRAMGHTPDDLGHLYYYSFPSLLPMDTPAGGAQMYDLAMHDGADLVVFDTTARIVTGEENSADTYRNLYRYTIVPLKAAGVTTLRLDHSGKDPTAGQRGSSAKADDVDTIWRLVAHDLGRFQLKCDMQRSGHHPPVIDLIRRSDPLRFDRAGAAGAGHRPEVETVITLLDQLGIPNDAGRPAARAALIEAGHRARNATVADAVRVRQVRFANAPNHSQPLSPPSGTAVPGDDLVKINSDCPQDQLELDDSPGQNCPGQLGDSGDSGDAGIGQPSCPPLSPFKRGQGTALPTPAPDTTDPTDTPADTCPRCRVASRLITFPPALGEPRQLCVECAYPDPSTRPGADPGDDL